MPGIELAIDLPWTVSGALILVAVTAVVTWRIANRNSQVSSEIAAIKTDIQSVKDGQSDHDTECNERNERIEKRFDALDSDMAELKTDMKWVKKHLNGGES